MGRVLVMSIPWEKSRGGLMGISSIRLLAM